MSSIFTAPAAAAPYLDRVRSSKAACTGTNETLINRGAYAGGTAYALNDCVTYNGVGYMSIQAANTGHAPDVSPTWWQPFNQVGLDLRNLDSIQAHLEMGAGNIPAAVTLQFWLLNAVTLQWNRAPGWDVAMQQIAAHAVPGFKVNASASRVLALPFGAAGAACSVYLNGTPLSAILAA